jgi:hypothetical protein
METKQICMILAVILLLVVLFMSGKKERFVSLTDEQKQAIKLVREDDEESRDKLYQLVASNPNFQLIRGILDIISTLNLLLNNQSDEVKKIRTSIENQGVNIESLKNNLADCVILILETSNEKIVDVIISSQFSSKLNNVFFELNKLNIAVVSSSIIPKDDFCRSFNGLAIPAFSSETQERTNQQLNLFNKILSAYTNLISVLYFFIIKNMNSINEYCGDEYYGSKQYKEFTKMFETIREAMITKEVLEKKCPTVKPEEVCSSFISQVSTCNQNLTSIKKEKTTYIYLIVILLIAVAYLAKGKFY